MFVFSKKLKNYLSGNFKNTVLFLCILFISCGRTPKLVSQAASEEKASSQNTVSSTKKDIVTGANQIEKYINLLKDKRVAIVGNQTSVIFKNSTSNQDTISYVHLVDSLQSLGINIVKVFAPEHGFRGQKDAAETVSDGKDVKTGVPVVSLYGKNKKPSAAALSETDIIIFDIQDVGVRFYTYISTLHYVMQSCAENKIPLLLLDRPNPNGHYIDGPTLESKYKSFLGMHPIPLVHGMTIGEYAKMINGQGWLGDDLTCYLMVIPITNYTHDLPYHLPIRPSPNLPNDRAIALYPSLGFFEGTTINAGRGTEMQFQIFGSPDLPLEEFDFAYTPQPNFGAKHPKHEGKICYGSDLRQHSKIQGVNLQWLIEAYNASKAKDNFFKKASFTAHAGSETLQKQIEQGISLEEIEKGWQQDILRFKKIREKYLLYP